MLYVGFLDTTRWRTETEIRCARKGKERKEGGRGEGGKREGKESWRNGTLLSCAELQKKKKQGKPERMVSRRNRKGDRRVCEEEGKGGMNDGTTQRKQRQWAEKERSREEKEKERGADGIRTMQMTENWVERWVWVVEEEGERGSEARRETWQHVGTRKNDMLGKEEP